MADKKIQQLRQEMRSIHEIIQSCGNRLDRVLRELGDDAPPKLSPIERRKLEFKTNGKFKRHAENRQ